MAASFRAACQIHLRASSFALTSRQLNATTITRAAHYGKKRRSIQAGLPKVSSQSSLDHKKSAPLDYNETSPYTPPTSGILGLLPRSLVPYGELARLDKPAGTYYLFAPCLFGTLLAASYATPVASLGQIVSTSALFLSGAFIMRGAGCTINDLWDRKLDPLVARTRLRPIARGAVTPFQAMTFLGAQLSVGLAILLQFPAACFWYATPSLLLVTLYPLAKRVTNYPQAVLGLTFSWGVFVAFPALGVDLLSFNADVDAEVLPFGLTYAQYSAGMLYVACSLWTILYDKIYAHQDIKYDAAAGIKSIALAHAHDARDFLRSVAKGTFMCFTVARHLSAGIDPTNVTALDLIVEGVVFAGTSLLCGKTLANMVNKVKLDDPADCARWFRKGVWYTGGAMAFALFMDYVMAAMRTRGKEQGQAKSNSSAVSSAVTTVS